MSRTTWLQARPQQRKRRGRARLLVELLEPRNLLSSGGVLGPLVQVANVDPFAGITTDNVAGQVGRNYANSQVEPRLAVDHGDPTHLVAVWQQDRWSNGGARGLVSAVSHDGGNTWTNVAAIPGLSLASGGTYDRASDPWVSLAPNGDVYVTSLSVSLAGPFPSQSAILVSKSTDGGMTWGSPTTLIADTEPFPKDLMNDKESVTADPTDATGQTAYVVWDRIEFPSDQASTDAFHSLGFRENILFSRTTDGGATWEPARLLTDFQDNKAAFSNQIVVEPDGTLVDLFTLSNGSGNQAPQADQNVIAVIRSTDHGVTWSDPIGGPAEEAIPVTDPDTGAAVRTGDFVPDFAVDPNNGNLYAVWHDSRFSKFDHDAIAFSMSTDGGLTWSDPIAINQTPSNITAADQQAFTPSIAVAANGTVAVTYYDFRNDDPNPGLPTDRWIVFASSNFTNPASWGGEQRLTDISFDMELAPQVRGLFVGDYQGLVAGGQDANSFSALFGQTVSSSQPAGIFFRDPSPAEAAPADAALAASGSAAETNQQSAFGATVPFSRAEFLTTPASATVSDPVPSPAAIPSRSLPPPAETAAVDHLFATKMSRSRLRSQGLDWWSDQELGQDLLHERDIF